MGSAYIRREESISRIGYKQDIKLKVLFFTCESSICYDILIT